VGESLTVVETQGGGRSYMFIYEEQNRARREEVAEDADLHERLWHRDRLTRYGFE